MEPLVLIPGRAGSKGVPGKNYKNLKGKPLIQYSIELARAVASDANICLSTDSKEIISLAESLGLSVPFVRPADLATDSANSRDVILHAVKHFRDKGRAFDTVLLLQPTSPFRKIRDVTAMLGLWRPELDMVVSVTEAHENPYYSLFEEDEHGYLHVSKKGSFTRRQDAPKVFSYNGSVYVITIASLESKMFSEFRKVVKYEMNPILSHDIDTAFDWMTAEMIIEKKLWETYE